MKEKTDKIQHTPGPWTDKDTYTFTTGQHKGDRHWAVFGTHGEQDPICLIAPYDNRSGEDIANARLIAAAPSLLVGCQEALTHCQLLGSGQHSTMSNSEMCDLLGEIISKATGK